MKCVFFCVALGLSLLMLSLAPARAQDSTIPTDGLELWVKADGPMTVSNGQITVLTKALDDAGWRISRLRLNGKCQSRPPALGPHFT